MHLILAFAVMTAVPELEDGTLLFVENSHNVVEQVTNSSYSHVAIVVDGFVYEANPPEVQKQSLEEWFLSVARANEGTSSPMIVSILRPKKPYQEQEIVPMRDYLENQVGRRYSVKGYLRQVPGDGIHCAEMCSTALEESGRIRFRVENFTISPGRLRKLVEASYIREGKKLYVRMKPVDRRGTLRRWADWWQHKGSWCQWSCWESLTFCF